MRKDEALEALFGILSLDLTSESMKDDDLINRRDLNETAVD